MSTSTPRLQLVKATGSESMTSAATDVLSDAWTKIDTAIGVTGANTEGLVVSPFVGQLLIEGSTNKSKIFNPAVWEVLYDPNDGQGKSQQLPFTNSIYTDDNEVELDEIILNVEAGRKYLGTFCLLISAEALVFPPGAGGHFFLNFKYTTNINSTPNILVHDFESWITTVRTGTLSKNIRGAFEFFPNITGQVKVAVTIAGSLNNFNIQANPSGNNGYLYFQDWGI